MNSSSERRVLDELVPDSTQKARDLQLIHHRFDGDLQQILAANLRVPPVFSKWHLPAVTNIHSISVKTRNRLAHLRPRLAFQLEAPSRSNTFSSNVGWRREELMKGAVGSSSPTNEALNLTMPQQTLQETTTTKWQKN